MVHKATFRKRVGIEVFFNGKQKLQDPKKALQVVAVKVLQGEKKKEKQKRSNQFYSAEDDMATLPKEYTSTIGIIQICLVYRISYGLPNKVLTNSLFK